MRSSRGLLFVFDHYYNIYLILVVIVVRNEKIVFLQKIGHALADCCTDKQSRDHGRKQSNDSERQNLRHRFNRSAAEIRFTAADYCLLMDNGGVPQRFQDEGPSQGGDQ